MLTIRNECAEDFQRVEEITRKAFWNLYVPGCSEHYLVHIMRNHEDFIPELDFVIEKDQEVVGNIMYTRSFLVDETGVEKAILTFGPVSILPEYQRCGLGKALMDHSFRKAAEMGFDAIVIFGSPANYVSRGFKSCKRFCISAADGSFPAAMMAKELVPGALSGKKWSYRDSPVMHVEPEAAEAFDAGFPKMEKAWQPSQEEFYILSHATLD